VGFRFVWILLHRGFVRGPGVQDGPRALRRSRMPAADQRRGRPARWVPSSHHDLGFSRTSAGFGFVWFFRRRVRFRRAGSHESRSEPSSDALPAQPVNLTDQSKMQAAPHGRHAHPASTARSAGPWDRGNLCRRCRRAAPRSRAAPSPSARGRRRRAWLGTVGPRLVLKRSWWSCSARRAERAEKVIAGPQACCIAMRHPGRSDNSLIHTAFSPGCDKVAQKCVIRAQKCAIWRSGPSRLAHSAAPMRRRPPPMVVTRLIGVGSRPIEVAEGESNRVWE